MIAWLLQRMLDRALTKAVARGWLTQGEEKQAAAAITTLAETLWEAYRRHQKGIDTGSYPPATPARTPPLVVTPIRPSSPGTTAADLNRVELERVRRETLHRSESA